MLKNCFCSNDATKGLSLVCLAVLLLLGTSRDADAQKPGAAKLLKEAAYYQSEDDTSDRAAELYRQLILKYPTSLQAEQAQFYLGTYYQNKFFIIQHRKNVQDWSAFNQAEAALDLYIRKYPRGSYLADAYYALALISLRRDYNNNTYRSRALSYLDKMAGQKADGKVEMYRVVWTPYPDDVLKRTCAKNQLANSERALINQNSTFDSFIVVLREWCKGNCY